MSQDTKNMILLSLRQLKSDGKRITIKAVADHAGISHSLIYNRYPELKGVIKEFQLEQSKQRERDLDKQTIVKLQTQLKNARLKNSQTIETETTALPELMAHLQQVYSMYDQILEERNEFAMQLTSIKKRQSE